MGLRYRIPFKDYKNTSYEVRVYRNDYNGEPTELTGASSCFVVSGTDEDFVYTPVRTSSATINVLDSELLLDLYSINSQYAKVELLRNGVLTWTGYIKPEQFTQPYVPTVESVSVECLSALATLEHIEYKVQTDSGYIKMMDLMRYLVKSAKGGYRGVYIPMSYGVGGMALEDIELCEENFTSEEMNLMEVMEAVCKFLNWTVFDIGGYLWFVDSDWDGVYMLYDENLSTFVEHRYSNEATMQNIGYLGSDSNTLDVIPGYNKASVRSVNNIFDEVIREEPFDILDVIQTWEWSEGQSEGARQVVRKFKEPMMWEMYYYNAQTMAALTQSQIEGMDIGWDVAGAVEMTELEYTLTKNEAGEWVPKQKEYNWVDIIRVRLDRYSYVLNGGSDRYKAFSVKGVNSVWKDGAFGVNMNLRYTKGNYQEYTASTLIDTDLWFMLRIGNNWYNGSKWVTSESKFRIRYNVNTGRGYQPIESNLNASMPYKGLQGYVIELPQDRLLKGDLEFTMYINDPAAVDMSGEQITGYFIKDFRLDYVKKDGVNDEGKNGDRIYENVVNEAYMSECDEIEFEIGSYNEDGATYSKALLGDGFLTDNLYCNIVSENVRPEELMIRRIVNRYGATKIKLTEAIQMTDEVTPLSALSDRTMVGKRFRMTSGEWDYEQNRIILQMQEEAE